MPLYLGNSTGIKNLFYANKRIVQAYYGTTLVYNTYRTGTVVFESGNPGQYPIKLLTQGVYELMICGAGGGGGGSATSHSWMGQTGGSGAAFKGNVILPNYPITIDIGTGGTGGSPSGAKANGGGNGTATNIYYTDGSFTLIQAKGGNGGNGTGGSYNNGAGGTLDITGLTSKSWIVSSEISTNGVANSNVSILGNGYGAGGVAQYHSSGTAGTSGYVKITFLYV